MKISVRGIASLLSLALFAACEKPAPRPPAAKDDEVVKQMREQIASLQDQLQRQSAELADLRARTNSEPLPPPGPSREKLQALCDRTFGKGIAVVLGIAESPDASAAVGEIRVSNLAIQGGSASGKADARIAHYNDGRWLLKSIRLYSTSGGRYSWDFEEEL